MPGNLIDHTSEFAPSQISIRLGAIVVMSRANLCAVWLIILRYLADISINFRLKSVSNETQMRQSTPQSFAAKGLELRRNETGIFSIGRMPRKIDCDGLPPTLELACSLDVTDLWGVLSGLKPLPEVHLKKKASSHGVTAPIDLKPTCLIFPQVYAEIIPTHN